MKGILDGKIALEIQNMNLGKMSAEERKELDLETGKFSRELTKKTLEAFKALGYKQWNKCMIASI